MKTSITSAQTKLVTDEMRQQIRERVEQLKADNPQAAVVEAWWDGDSLFTANPKIKTRVVAKLKEKNT